MSFATTEQEAAGAAESGVPTAPNAQPWGQARRELCPLCGEPLRDEQSWCLRCGAAARTRLAAPAKWKPLVSALAAVALLSLAVLVVALVKLAG